MTKQLFAFFLLLTIATTAFSQETAPAPKKKFQLKNKGSEDIMILNFNLDGWQATPDSVNTKWFSRGFDIYLMYDSPLEKSNFSIAIGTGLGSHNVHSNSIVTDTNIGGDTIITTLNPIKGSYKKNKLSTTFIDIVAELRYKTKADKHGRKLKISAGAKYGFLINTHSKLILGGVKTKAFNFTNMNNRRFGIVGRIGYGKIGLSVFYSVSKLFKTAKGSPAIKPFSIGLTITPF